MRSLSDKFHDKIMADPNSGCWLWTGSLNTSGYGQFSIKSDGISKAHRAAWKLYHGEIPAGKQVLHKCDVRSCCNPDHLFLGDNNINVADKIAKGRGVYGESHGRSKLTEADVLTIRSLRGKRLLREIAEMFGVSRTTVADAQHGKYWAHVN